VWVGQSRLQVLVSEFWYSRALNFEPGNLLLALAHISHCHLLQPCAKRDASLPRLVDDDGFGP
jgi:hypothetical protein